MGEPSLAYTAVTKANQYEFMADKIWYKFSDQTTKFDAWKTWATASGSTAQKAAAAKFSGRTIDFTISNKFIKGWPTPDFSKKHFEYVTRWSGGCLRDHSSGVGGFCLIEDNPTAFWDCGDIDSTEAAPARGGSQIEICGPTAFAQSYNAVSDCNALVSNSNSILEEDRYGPVNIYWNRSIASVPISASKGTATVYKLTANPLYSAKSSTATFMFYRLAASDFTTLEGAWEDTTLQCDKDGAPGINKQDGRAFQLSIRKKKMTIDATKVQYFDYPKCTLNTASSAYEWACQMYLPLRSKQDAGYPRFDEPGVITGYYFSSYLPSLKEVSYAKSTAVNSSGALELAKYAAFVTGIVAVMF